MISMPRKSAIGQFVTELKRTGDYESTLIVITAKHGQSPIDSSRYTGITKSGPVTTPPATILEAALFRPPFFSAARN
jgi:arylsulfatase A-like enzyme